MVRESFSGEQESFAFYERPTLSFREAAAFVLAREGKPLRPEEIVQRAIDAGVLRTGGETPEQTMKAKLSVEIRRRGEESRFKRTEPGRFALSEWDQYQTYLAPRYTRQHKETVLAVRTEEANEIVTEQGLGSDPLKMGELTLRAEELDRGHAETTEAYRQLVTVFAVLYGSDILTFRRSGHVPEERLHGTWAVLFGGHVQPSDFCHPLLCSDPESFIRVLSFREVQEELRVPHDWRLTPIGVLRDDDTALGRQHLGLVSVLTAPSRVVIEQTSYALDGEYIPLPVVMERKPLDRWSEIVVSRLLESL